MKYYIIYGVLETMVSLIYIFLNGLYKFRDIPKVQNVSGIHQNVLYKPHCCIMTLKTLINVFPM